MAGQRIVRLGPFAVSMYRPLLWSLSLRTSKHAWVMRAQVTRQWRVVLFGLEWYWDDDSELVIEAGFWPLKLTLHRCELQPVPSDALLAWADMEVD